MDRYRQIWREVIRRAYEEESGQVLEPEAVVVETPPRPELGDLGFPMFPYARTFRRPPAEIAGQLAARIAQQGGEKRGRGSVAVEGPYLNVRLDRPAVTQEVIAEVLQAGDSYGQGKDLAGKRVVVEFSSPNTNKPLHLGHLRNDAIGMSIARLVAAQGAGVLKVNLVNNRGVHICKSMLAYREFGDELTPERAGVKSDHLVGDFYVRFAEWARQEPGVEERAQQMLKAWEEGDPEVRALWEKMNRWAIEGIEQTYRKTGVSFDRVYLESETYLLGQREVLEGLERGLFYREQDGSVWVDLSAEGLDRKVLLRSDGTSLYLTQDLGTAIQRSRDWPFDRMIYVVGNEQRYHFQLLFRTLQLLGYPWAQDLHHLAYGMVNLPEGKMKSREGTVVDADELIADLERLAAEEIREKGREADVENLPETAERITLGALNYYLLQASPYKDMLFDPRESISFSGNTGPYLQYTGARLSSMLRKFEQRKSSYAGGSFRAPLLSQEDDWNIVKLLAAYPDMVLLAERELNPSLAASHLFELAQAFSRYWHDNPVLHNEDSSLVVSRIHLARAVRQVLSNGMALIGVPFLSRM
jgi:arginyl-tRNA synthetase